MLKTLTSITRRCLFSSTCLLCSRSSSQPLCQLCLELLPVLGQVCPRCALPLPQSYKHDCANCLQTPPPFCRTVASFHYQIPVQSMLLELKFKQGLYWLPLLCEQMASSISSAYPQGKMPEMLVPVPLHSHRMKQRGYNQALEIAKLIARRLQLPYTTKLCRRIRDTEAQAALSAKQRASNMKHAFEIITTPPSSIAIIDDVMTTGHTVNDLASQFLQAGVNEVHVWCCARTANFSTI